MSLIDSFNYSCRKLSNATSRTAELLFTPANVIAAFLLEYSFNKASQIVWNLVNKAAGPQKNNQGFLHKLGRIALASTLWCTIGLWALATFLTITLPMIILSLVPSYTLLAISNAVIWATSPVTLSYCTIKDMNSSHRAKQYNPYAPLRPLNKTTDTDTTYSKLMTQAKEPQTAAQASKTKQETTHAISQAEKDQDEQTEDHHSFNLRS